MSGIGAAIVGGSVLTGILSANAQKSAAEKAAQAQTAANQAQLAAQSQGFNQALGFQQNQLASGNQLAQAQQAQLQKLFAPFVNAAGGALGGLGQFGQGGLQAFNQQLALAGASGADAQTAAISSIENSPLFQELAKQGREAVLQSRSPLGLRGGNTEAALAQFQPQLLNQLIQQQFANLGSLSGLGAQSQGTLAQLAGTGANVQGQLGAQVLGSQLGLNSDIARNIAALQGQNTSAIADLLGQQGEIGAGQALAEGRANGGLYQGIGNAINLAGFLNRPGIGSTAANPNVGALGPDEGASMLLALGNRARMGGA